MIFSFEGRADSQKWSAVLWDVLNMESVGNGSTGLTSSLLIESASEPNISIMCSQLTAKILKGNAEIPSQTAP
jgi:hypothetical protein